VYKDVCCNLKFFLVPTLSVGTRSNARDAGAESHNKAFPLSHCNPKCIKAQLDNYRDKACGKDENPELNYVKIVPIKNTGGIVK